MRAEIRSALGTGVEGIVSTATTSAGFQSAAGAALAAFTTGLTQQSERELLLGFPAAPFVLPLAATDKNRFLAFSDAYPDHAVRLRRTGQAEGSEWTVSPCLEPDAYHLTFKLPDHVEAWIGDVAGKERQRTQEIKEQFLAAITVYRTHLQEGVRFLSAPVRAG